MFIRHIFEPLLYLVTFVGLICTSKWLASKMFFFTVHSLPEGAVGVAVVG